jgi:hypothetical protein
MNHAFLALLNEKISSFRYSFAAASRQAFVDPTTGKLFHAGEFGTYREGILRDFLRLCVPARLEIGTGFLINSKGSISTQADVVIYDRSAVPRIESKEHQRFFPVEGVCAIGEGKSRLSKGGMRDALNKLARAKATADNVSSSIAIFRDRTLADKNFSRETNVYDQMFSFLVCEGFDFDYSSLSHEVSGWYDDDIQNHHKHNLVLSVEDGLLLYVDKNKVSWMYPSIPTYPVKCRFLEANSNDPLHFHYFCSYMFLATSSATVLFPEMATYMPSLEVKTIYDEP